MSHPSPAAYAVHPTTGRRMTGPVSETTSSYLRAIYNLNEDGVTVRRARLSERMGHAGPTVTQTVTRLQRDGLVEQGSDHQIRLTDSGRDVAVAITRKHRLAERMLADILALPVLQVHAEASRWENSMSEATERAILAQLDDPSTSPWGNPIPGLAEFGVNLPPRPATVSLREYTDTPTTVLTVVRSISEDAQADIALLTGLVSAGIVPGARVAITADDQGGFRVHAAGTFALTRKQSHVLQVDPAL
ncbi:MAG: metal-dependent transcriptional regulator [Gordonia sp. (in: high G+C Gram-positive bacteria)]